jgi:hypothetical protein|tara:strand:+ start:834 stop:968 length:135 start_codon:yes stop_codon:yes gene_type:complete
MTKDLNKKIARYEEQLAWLEKMAKDTKDKLFCAKAELQEKQNDR